MNLMMLLDMAAEAQGDRIAVGSLDSGITYRQLHDRALQAAARFKTAHAKTATTKTVTTKAANAKTPRDEAPNDKAANAKQVVLCDESSPAVPICLFGAATAGMPYVPLNYRLADAELVALAQRSVPSVAITDNAGAARLANINGLKTITREKFLSSVSRDLSPSAVPDSTVSNDDIAVLLHTSGTSGTPKTAVLRHRHLVSYILGSVEFMAATEDEATIVAVPPYHVAGVAAILSSVYAGRRIVQLPKFDPDDWIDTVERENITHAMVVPTMLARIVDALDARGGEPCLTLRSLSYGGGRMPLPVISRALELFPITSFVNAYGLTETSSTIAVLGPDDHRLAQYSDELSEQKRLGSAGRPLPSMTISIRDQTGEELLAGESGEIFVRGEQVSGEYLQSGSTLVDGWFPTHDNGYIDEAGYLFVQGRNDDMIIRGGENISPAEIEDVLLSHPAVKDAAAIGITDRHWGEKVVAVVVPAETAPPSAVSCSEHDLQELVRLRLRSSRVPAQVVWLDELPYNETGKLLRNQLRSQFSYLGDSDSGSDTDSDVNSDSDLQSGPASHAEY